MKNFIESFVRVFKSKRESRKIIRIVSKFIKKNFNNICDKREIPGLKERVWYFEDFKLVHCRMIRGDLIELINKDNEIISSWADQSYQYGFLLGWNDFQRNENVSSEFVERNLKSYKKMGG